MKLVNREKTCSAEMGTRCCRVAGLFFSLEPAQCEANPGHCCSIKERENGNVIQAQIKWMFRLFIWQSQFWPWVLMPPWIFQALLSWLAVGEMEESEDRVYKDGSLHLFSVRRWCVKIQFVAASWRHTALRASHHVTLIYLITLNQWPPHTMSQCGKKYQKDTLEFM